jgi:hypothetical protein
MRAHSVLVGAVAALAFSAAPALAGCQGQRGVITKPYRLQEVRDRERELAVSGRTGLPTPCRRLEADQTARRWRRITRHDVSSRTLGPSHGGAASPRRLRP